MGNCFSDPSKPKKLPGQGQKLGSAPVPPSNAVNPPLSTRVTPPQPPRTLGGNISTHVGDDVDARARALAAAEERQKTVRDDRSTFFRDYR
jgi:hypothetical protein